MDTKEDMLERLRPTQKPQVIDLVRQAGLDVSDWANYRGGPQRAGANPKYCYEWCFEQEGMFVFNIWFENIVVEDGAVLQRLNLRSRPGDMTGPRKARARRFDQAAKKAYETGSNPRVIILNREVAGKGSTYARLLDDAPWTVVKYDLSTGDFELQRGLVSERDYVGADPEAEEFLEGEPRRRFVIHRKREAKLRHRKIEQHKLRTGGRLICEVPECGFDFELRYGELGRDYAQVHHLVPLSRLESGSVGNTVDDLVVVCANCHAMIHRGGQCRTLDELIPVKARQ